MLNRALKGVLFFFILISPLISGQSQDTERVRVYRVQFAASKTFLQPSYFERKFNLEDSVQYFQKDGWYKYFVGDFQTEAEAQEYYHKTGDVGYVISMLIEKPIEVEQDTTQVAVMEDSLDLDTTQIISADTTLETKTDTTGVQEKPQEYQEKPVKKDGKGLTGTQLLLLCMGVVFILIILYFVIQYRRMQKGEGDSDDSGSSGDSGDSGDAGDAETGSFLSGKEPFAFLDRSDEDLPEWQQIRILEEMRRKKIDPPDFAFWLDSENISIVAFCLRMIRSFEQKDSYDQVARLLDHESDEIRAEAIVTLGEIGNKEALKLFREKYERENYTNRMLILRAMARMPDEGNIEFLKEILKVKGSFQVEAAHALSAVKSFGIDGVEQALKDLGQDSDMIARHILINKL